MKWPPLEEGARRVVRVGRRDGTAVISTVRRARPWSSGQTSSSLGWRPLRLLSRPDQRHCGWRQAYLPAARARQPHHGHRLHRGEGTRCHQRLGQACLCVAGAARRAQNDTNAMNQHQQQPSCDSACLRPPKPRHHRPADLFWLFPEQSSFVVLRFPAAARFALPPSPRHKYIYRPHAPSQTFNVRCGLISFPSPLPAALSKTRCRRGSSARHFATTPSASRRCRTFVARSSPPVSTGISSPGMWSGWRKSER